jgi:hypothetical protein
MLGRLGVLNEARQRQEQRDTREESVQERLQASVEAYVFKTNRRERQEENEPEGSLKKGVKPILSKLQGFSS